MRSFAATVAVLVATLVAPLAIASTWLTARVDDRDEYVDTVAGLAHDPTVRQVLADAAADAAVSALQQHIPVGLPEEVRAWAGRAATMVVESPEFPEFWRTANGDLHDQVLAVLEHPDAPADGSITVDAGPLVAQVLLELEDRGIPVGLLPDVALRVPVMQEAKVAEAGPAYRTVDGLLRLIPFVGLGLVVLAVLVARGWRGRLRALGLALLGLALAAVVVLLAADPVATAALDRVEAERRELAGVLVDTVVGSLESSARGLLLAAPVGLVLVVLSLWSRRRHGSAVREHDYH
ncbi:hypothetical protein FHP29_01060 [Nocardioides albidus]|uniref:Integral membrane protein n=1 Tax=Nocardioides albidus TaxID=1517589 RepID=A0A5C4WPN5_9ACTN|nr:hypothetical protein [Nocardioides albidus]TNM50151.1 hypothetical protein FHP29_01060 [Nocardioides albidus]